MVFRNRYSYFEYWERPFYLFNALASFQEYIHELIAKKLDFSITVYLDDILIYNNDAKNVNVV